MRSRDRNRAFMLIADRMGEASDQEIKSALCAFFGHPPVVHTFFGYVYCSRCDAQVGDQLASVYSNKENAVKGHDCEDCRRIWKSLTPTERLLTNNPLNEMQRAQDEETDPAAEATA